MIMETYDRIYMELNNCKKKGRTKTGGGDSGLTGRGGVG